MLLSHKVDAAGAAMLLAAPEVLPACIPCGSLPKAQGPVSMPRSSLDVMGILSSSRDLGQRIWPWQRSGLGVLSDLLPVSSEDVWVSPWMKSRTSSPPCPRAGASRALPGQSCYWELNAPSWPSFPPSTEEMPAGLQALECSSAPSGPHMSAQCRASRKSRRLPNIPQRLLLASTLGPFSCCHQPCAVPAVTPGPLTAVSPQGMTSCCGSSRSCRQERSAAWWGHSSRPCSSSLPSCRRSVRR